MVAAGLLVLAGNANVPYTQPIVVENPSNQTDEQDQEETYVQSFDVVSQNVQLQFISTFLLNEPISEIIAHCEISDVSVFKLASSEFFKILFQKIISPNAP